jgi:hypothetical protein
MAFYNDKEYLFYFLAKSFGWFCLPRKRHENAGAIRGQQQFQGLTPNDLRYQRIPRKSFRYSFSLDSIPTAPTIYLSDRWTFNKNTRGQKGADWANDPVLCFFSAARVTTGRINFSLQSIFPRTPFPGNDLKDCK